MLGGHVRILHLVGLGVGSLKRRLGLPGEAYLSGPVHGPEMLQPPRQVRPHGGMAGADTFQYRYRKSSLLIQEATARCSGSTWACPRSS